MGLPIDPGSGRSLPYRLVTANRPGFASAADNTYNETYVYVMIG